MCRSEVEVAVLDPLDEGVPAGRADGQRRAFRVFGVPHGHDARQVTRDLDAADEMPARQDAGPDSEPGRGLTLVAGLVSQWGSGRTHGGGKVTWAVV